MRNPSGVETFNPGCELAIAVVYVVDEGQEWLLRLHLNQIETNSADVQYRIYAALPRVSPQARIILREDPHVREIDIPPTADRSSREHAYYLDHLVQVAFEDGAQYIATFDLDSFPIRECWCTELTGRLSARKPLAAVWREENLDVNLPHPSGVLFRSDFYARFQPRFLPGDSPSARKVASDIGQRWDTGIGYAVAISASGLDWLRLRRSNRHNDHYLLGGVYADTIYHLGAANRHPLFTADWKAPVMAFTARLGRVPVLRRLHTLACRRRLAANSAARDRIISAMQADFPKYLRHLREGLPYWRLDDGEQV